MANLAGNNITDAILSAQAETGTLPGQTALELQFRGVSIFDLPVLIKVIGLKVWSKKKYLVPRGNVATYQYRDPKNHYVTAASVREGVPNTTVESQGLGFVQDNLTRGVFIVTKKVPGGTGNATLECNVTRKYSYTQILSSADLS